MKFSVRTSERYEREIVAGRVTGTRRIPTVELWIGGIRFVTDAASDDAARVIAERTVKELGLDG